MSKFIITGPTRLSGTFKVGGSKNAVLPIMAAAVLFDNKISLSNVPDISDVASMLHILDSLGIQADWDKSAHCLKLDCSNQKNEHINHELTGGIRASILLLGPLLSRYGSVSLAMPGGDIIGARPLATHFDGLTKMGVEVSQPNGKITANNSPYSAEITLRELSVTATENLICAAVKAQGTSVIRLAACEPHVVALCEFLNSAGAKISGISTHTLTIEGVAQLHSTDFTIPYDYLEAGTMAIAAAATKSELTIDGFVQHDNDALLNTLTDIGVHYDVVDKKTLHIRPSSEFRSSNVRTDIYPGFPSDLQAPLAILLTQANGTSELFETLYEGRLNYFSQLKRMGANCSIRDTHTGIITGPTPLYGAELISVDVRAGATMVVAALLAEGTSTLDHVEHIDRGYERFDERLAQIGARISRLD